MSQLAPELRVSRRVDEHVVRRTTCPRLFRASGTAGARTRDLLSRESKALTISPSAVRPYHTAQLLKRKVTRDSSRLGVAVTIGLGLAFGGLVLAKYLGKIRFSLTIIAHR